MINQERLVAAFCRLVSVDAPSLGERNMADVLKAELEGLGLEVWEDDAGKKLGGTAGNLFCRVPGRLPGPPLLFSAHMDTVEPSRGKRAVCRPNGKIESEGDTVLGADDMAGVAAILEALATAREQGIPLRELELVFPVAEELHTLGSAQFDRSLLRAEQCYVLDLDGPVGDAALDAPSILTFQADFIGRAAHAGMAPEKGVHAIRLASRAISAMDMGRVKEGLTVNVGCITGGGTTNIVPECCTVTGEVRGFDHQLALAEMERICTLFRITAEADGGRCKFSSKVCCVAYHWPESCPAARRFSRACQELGLMPHFRPTFGGSDNNNFARWGISGLVMANAMQDIHSCQENTSVEQLAAAAELTLKLMSMPDE